MERGFDLLPDSDANLLRLQLDIIALSDFYLKFSECDYYTNELVLNYIEKAILLMTTDYMNAEKLINM